MESSAGGGEIDDSPARVFYAANQYFCCNQNAALETELVCIALLRCTGSFLKKYVCFHSGSNLFLSLSFFFSLIIFLLLFS